MADIVSVVIALAASVALIFGVIVWARRNIDRTRPVVQAELERRGYRVIRMQFVVGKGPLTRDPFAYGMVFRVRAYDRQGQEKTVMARWGFDRPTVPGKPYRMSLTRKGPMHLDIRDGDWRTHWLTGKSRLVR